MAVEQTLGEIWDAVPFRSLWHERMRRLAAGTPLTEFLVQQANLRGFLGSFGREELSGTAAALSLEEIVIGLLSPFASLDGRLFKLLLRMLQSGKMDVDRLVMLAKRERADVALWWLLETTPLVERTDPLARIAQRMGHAPRGFRLPDYNCDSRRLIRRPAMKEYGWRTPPN